MSSSVGRARGLRCGADGFDPHRGRWCDRRENVVFAAAAADVTDVVVDGRAVVVDRKHVTVPDVEA